MALTGESVRIRNIRDAGGHCTAWFCLNKGVYWVAGDTLMKRVLVLLAILLFVVAGVSAQTEYSDFQAYFQTFFLGGCSFPTRR